jgi:NAD(P)-dependent dehydrogenase (short-subunit alcohol dehydrogenase family)
MSGTFTGKVALITGGNAGIGRATALAFAREGARVAIAARRSAEGEATVAHIKDAGGDAVFIPTDVSQADEVAALLRRLIEIYGRLDYACNNAGIAGTLAPTADQTVADWDRVITTNLRGTWLCMKYEVPHMLHQGQGVIVNIASELGLVAADWGMSPYIASKHGIVGLTKAAALEYAKRGIRVNAVCPFNVRTAMIELATGGTPEGEAALAQLHPLGRLGTPEDVAEAVVWLCSERASFVTGVALPVDGGALAH